MYTDATSITPKQVFVVTPGGDVDQKVTTAINDARTYVRNTNGLAIVYFQEGDYYIHTSISLNQHDRNIVFQGAGSDKTTLVFQNLANSHCFSLSGNAYAFSLSDNNDLDQWITKGTSILHAATGKGLSTLAIGDTVHFVMYSYDYQTPNPPIVPDIVKIGRIR